VTRYTDMYTNAAWESHKLAYGETVSYRPLGVAGSAVSITAQFTRRQVAPVNMTDARQLVDGGDLKFLEADISTTADVTDTVVVDSKTYAVTRIDQRTPLAQVQLEYREDKRVGMRSRIARV